MKSLVKKMAWAGCKLVARAHIKLRPMYEKAFAAIQFEGVGKIGRGVQIEGGGVVLEKEKISIGNDVFLGRNFFLRGAGGIHIGDYTHISRNVTIHTVNHNMHGCLLPYDRADVVKPVRIGSYVWIGMNVNILPGVEIGDGAIIGMGTTVSKSVENNTIVVGPSQRVIGHRDEEATAALVRSGQFLRIKNGNIDK